MRKHKCMHSKHKHTQFCIVYTRTYTINIYFRIGAIFAPYRIAYRIVYIVQHCVKWVLRTNVIVAC